MGRARDTCCMPIQPIIISLFEVNQFMCLLFSIIYVETVGQHPYIYMKDLVELEARAYSTELALPAGLNSIVTPLHTPAWRTALSEHPDKDFAQYMCNRLSHGFHIGFDCSQPTKSVRVNMPSASLHSKVITKFLDKERSLGRIMGPFHDTRIQVNRCGVVPKGLTQGRWRVITDLSFPPNGSVNDDIDPVLCSLTYLSVETVAHTVSLLGTGAMMAKIDIEAAYRLLPVHRQDRLLYLVSSGIERFFVTLCCRLGYAQLPKFSTRLQMDLSGYCSAKG